VAPDVLEEELAPSEEEPVSEQEEGAPEPVEAPAAEPTDSALRYSAAAAAAFLGGGAGLQLADVGLERITTQTPVGQLVLLFPLLGAAFAGVAAFLPLPAMLRGLILGMVGFIHGILLAFSPLAPVALVAGGSRRLLMALCLLLTTGLIWRSRGAASLAANAVVLLGVLAVAANYGLPGIGHRHDVIAALFLVENIQRGDALEAVASALGLLPLLLVVPALAALHPKGASFAGMGSGGLLAWFFIVPIAAGLASAPSDAGLLGWLSLSLLAFASALAVSVGFAETSARLVGEPGRAP
jgi:hypothetical protein